MRPEDLLSSNCQAAGLRNNVTLPYIVSQFFKIVLTVKKEGNTAFSFHFYNISRIYFKCWITR